MSRLRWASERWFPPVVADEIRPGRHSLPLDGVRGLAVLLVLCYDCLKLPASADPLTFAARKFAASGWAGVDLFFVLSGFLITGILLDTVGRPRYWRSFLARRALRIFPLYYATLIGVFLIAPAFRGMMTVEAAFALDAIERDQAWYWFYGQNWLYAIRGAWPEERVLNHFWSLAIEEQFYLIWPLVVCLFTRRQLFRICLGLSGLALSLRCGLLLNGVPGVVTYVMTVTRVDSLCSGAVMAILIRDRRFLQNIGPWLPAAAFISGLGLLGCDACWHVLQSQSVPAYSIGHSLLAVTFGLMIGACAAVPERHLLARIFSLRPMLTLGKYSYAMYVFHRFVHAAVVACDWSVVPEPLQGWGIFMATLLGTLLASLISWHVIEKPCLSWKDSFPRPDEVGQRSRIDVDVEVPKADRVRV